MKHCQKIVWYEGMFIKPHHFQQADRYNLALLNARVRAAFRHDWGITEMEVDNEALANGQFILLRCSGVMPDGLPFNMPDVQPLPPSQNFSELFTAKRETLAVFLALPVEQAGGLNCLLDGSGDKDATRFVLQNVPLTDDNTGSNEQEIGVALPNFQIRFGDTPPPGVWALKIAILIRQKNNTFALHQKYIPPCLHVNASETLKKIQAGILGQLVEKSATLKERRRRQPSGQVEFSNVDVNIFWLLHTVNSFIPLLSHFYNLRELKCHPEELYTVLLTLAGQLTTFSPEGELKFPQYDHDKLYYCYNLLYEEIRKLLDQALPPRNYVNIPLESKDGSLYLGRIVNEALFSTAQFYLVMKGEFDERKVADEIPQHLKISSPEEINDLAGKAVQGLRVSGVSRPPVGTPAGAGLLYLRLEKSGIFWDNIRRSGAIAILLTAQFKHLKPMLIAVTEER